MRYQQECYDVIMDKKNSDPDQVYLIMRKAYILHAAVAFEHNSASTTALEAPAERSFFSIQARVARTQHERYVE